MNFGRQWVQDIFIFLHCFCSDSTHWAYPASTRLFGRLSTRYPHTVDQRFPTWGTCTLGVVHLPIWRGTFTFSNRGENTLKIYYILLLLLLISKYLYIYRITFKNKCMLFMKNYYIIYLWLVMMKNWEKSIYAIAWNSRGACSSVEMLNGHMVRERLGTSAVDKKVYLMHGRHNLQ